MSKQDLKIMGIKGGGFANLTVVNVKLDKGVNEVGGKNRQGKSNLMALLGAFRGKEHFGQMPLNKDSEKGKFTIPIVDSEDEVRYTVKYSFTKNDTYVKVLDEEGKSVHLQVLKDLLSPCMDPSELFYNATSTGTGAKDRRMRAIGVIRELMKYNTDNETLLDSIGLNADAHIKSLLSQHKDDPIAFLDALDAHVCSNRKEYKDKLAQAKGTQTTLKEAVPPEMRKIEEIDASDIIEKQRELQESSIKSAQALEKGRSLEGRVTALEAELKAAKDELEAFREAHGDDTSEKHASEELEELENMLGEREEHNRMARKAAELREVGKSIEGYEMGIEARDDIIDKIRSERVKTIENADMPIEGLSIKGDTIYKNGIPLGQDSTEEGLTDSFMIGLAKFEAMNPDQERLKTMLIENASLMDSDAKKRLYDLAAEHDVQLVVELVLDEPQQGVIFVDGGVANNVEEDDEK
jgi:hypothetical protein